MTIFIFAALTIFPSQTNDIDEVFFYPLTDSIIIGFAASGSLFLEAAKDQTTSETCSWCAKNRMDEYFRSLLKWENTDRARNLSNIFLGLSITGSSGIMITSTLMNYDFKKSIKRFALFSEVILTSILLNSFTKRVFSRERPYVRDSEEGFPDHDHNVSFYSGHTSTAFVFVTAAASFICSDTSPAILWTFTSAGLIAALMTGYFRIAGDNHYISDVVAGAAVGISIGILIPWLHRKKRRHNFSVYLLPSHDGAVAGFSTTF